MQVERVPLDSLTVATRHRQADPAKVRVIADSMARHGQLQPVTVYQSGEYSCTLVAGLHRVQAARSLGWEEIDAVFVEGDVLAREMLEIAENLHRCDLTKEERDRQIRRYAELLEALPRQTVAPTEARVDGRRKGPQHEKGVAAKVAEETGLSVRTVQRVLAPPKPVPPAREPHNDYEAVQKQVDSLMRAWNAAGPEAREQFLERVDRPVFDRTEAA